MKKAMRQRKGGDKRASTGSNLASSGTQVQAPEAGPPSRPAARTWVALGTMALAYFVLAITSLIQKSVTVDEFGHLPTGYRALTTADFSYCTLNPPLMNLLSAIPLLAMDMTGADVDPTSGPDHEPGFWTNGYAFVARFAEDYHMIYTAARCVTVVIVGLLGLLLFGWARILAPRGADLAGLLAAGLVWFSPGMMAHARLVTTDAGIAFFAALAIYSLHLYLRHPRVSRASAVGIALGLAQLVKFTAIYLYPIALVLTVAWIPWHRDTPRRRLALGLAVIFCVSILTINCGYLFHGSGRPLGEMEFVSGPLDAVQRVLPARTPVPLPESYLSALDRQVRDATAGDPSFLFGESYRGDKWYYFIALLAVKTPIPTLLLALFVVGVGLRARAYRSFSGILLLLPGALFLLVLSLFSNKQLGLRMILPAAPLFWLWISVTLARTRWRRWMKAAAATLLIWFVGESLWIYPDYMTYFNQSVGGPSQGYRYAADSNLDWGQDLIGLKRYMEEKELDSIQLLYFGRVPPETYGITYEVPSQGLRPGLLAISVSLMGRGYVLNDHGTLYWVGPIEIDAEVLGPPVANIGNSIHVYRVRGGSGRQ